jgi:hypothetical protein
MSAHCSVCFALATATHAQLTESDSPSERDARTAAPVPGPREESAISAQQYRYNSQLIVHLADGRVRRGRKRLAVRVPCSGSSGRRAAAHRSAGSGYSPMYASNGRRAVSSRSFRSGLALPKSAEFLRELRAQFSNLGLAAAAYNAGPQRVRDWLAGKRTLPSETQTYVRNVTGHLVQKWARQDQKSLTVTIPMEMPCPQIQTAKLVASRNHPPPPFNRNRVRVERPTCW